MPDIFVAEDKTQEPDAEKEEVKTQEPDVQKEETVPRKETKPFELPKSGGTVHLFSSYCENPDDISFENQEEDEGVLLFIRKDLITNIPWVITGFLLVSLPLIILPISSILRLPGIALPQNYIFVTAVFYYLFVATFLFISFITWYFNIDIVTQQRIVDIDFEGVVYKNIAATKISLVQDVSYSQVGVVRTLFDYGNVLVQTAGTIDNFTFESVPRPEDAVHIIEDLIGKRRD